MVTHGCVLIFRHGFEVELEGYYSVGLPHFVEVGHGECSNHYQKFPFYYCLEKYLD